MWALEPFNVIFEYLRFLYRIALRRFSEMALSLPLTADERAVLATLPKQQDDHAL